MTCSQTFELRSTRFRRWVNRALLPVASAAGCANVLAIEEPYRRPVEGEGGDAGREVAGEGGKAGASAGEAGRSSSDGGESGAPSAGQGGEEAGGRGGADGEPFCVAEERRCGGEAAKTPEICAQAETWIVNEDENDGEDCPELCVLGECVECVEPSARCSGPVRQVCEGGTWQSRELCDDYCRAGGCESAPSCAGGLECEGAVSCCRALEVPGGTFKRDYDGFEYKDDSYTATVDGFLLDKFEVTVGRFRRFVEAYDDIHLVEGDGRAEHVLEDTGWDENYDIPETEQELKAVLEDLDRCPDTTWTDGATQTNELLPANCVTFPYAYAFCISDGGRLPTEAEWNYAAAGGSEQRQYPWQAPFEEEPPTDQRAVFERIDGLPLAVGGRPTGDGRYGHSDLTGNVHEWTLDFLGGYPSDCVNCMNATFAEHRAARGGSYLSPADTLPVSRRWEATTDEPSRGLGFRCVRDLD
jgi:sulfatase modifying factor 1